MIGLELEHTQTMLDGMMFRCVYWNTLERPRPDAFTNRAVYWALREALARTSSLPRLRRYVAEIALEYGLDDSVCWWEVEQ